MQRYSLNFEIVVHDKDALANAAIEHAAAEGEEADRYREDPEACLIMLLDPGAGGGACVSNLADLGIEITEVSCSSDIELEDFESLPPEASATAGERNVDGASPEGQIMPVGHIPESFEYDPKSSWDVVVYNDHIGLKLVIDRAIDERGEFTGWRYRLIADQPDAPLAESTDLKDIEAALIAEYFHVNLREVLTPDQWVVMLDRNRGNGDYVCASHDFCDANMVMAQTFEFVTGREAIGDSEMPSDHIDVWSRAWEIAKAKYLTGKTPLRAEEGTGGLGHVR